jgi:hypothetical protein
MKRKVRTTDVAQKTSYEAAQEEISIDLKKDGGSITHVA